MPRTLLTLATGVLLAAAGFFAFQKSGAQVVPVDLADPYGVVELYNPGQYTAVNVQALLNDKSRRGYDFVQMQKTDDRLLLVFKKR